MSSAWSAVKSVGKAAVRVTAGVVTGGASEVYKYARDKQKEAEREARKAKEAARQSRIDAMTDRLVTGNGSASPRNIIYGEVRTGGQLVLNESSGTDAEFMHIIVVFAAHTCKQIKDVYFDDDVALKWDGYGHGVDAKYAGLVDFAIEHGKQTIANPKAVSQATSWTESDKLLGQTYIYLRFKFEEEKYSRGIPNVTAIIEGKDDILDPRNGSTGYSNNQALCTLDYLLWSRGANLPLAGIDLPSFIAGANLADQLVVSGVGKTEKRYTCNGSTPFGAPPAQIVEALASAGASSVTRKGGKRYFVSGSYSAPTVSFDESDLIGGVNFSPRTPKEARANIAKGTFIDPAQDYAVVDFVHLAVDAYIQEDKEELEIDNAYEFTNSGTMARRISKIYLEQSRFGLMVDVTLKFQAVALRVGQRINLSIAPLGWTNRIFRIMDLNIDIKSGVQIILREDSPAIYSWTEGDALTVTAPPALNLPDPFKVEPPINLQVSEELYTGTNKSEIIARAILTWQQGSLASRYYDIEYRPSNGVWIAAQSNWKATGTSISNLEAGLYQFRVRAGNSLGALSEWTQVEYFIRGKLSPPANVPSITAEQKSYGVVVRFAPVPDLDVDKYELRTDANFGSSEGLLYSGSQRQFTDIQRVAGSVTYYVKAIDTSGNYSLSPTMVTPSISLPSAVTNVNVTSIDNNVLLRWSTSDTVYPIAHYVIKKGDNLATAQLIGESSGTFEAIIEDSNGNFRYWVIPVDVAGQEGEAKSVIASVDAPPDYILRADDYVNFDLVSLVNATLGFGGGGFEWSDTQLRWDDVTLRWDDAPSPDILLPVNTVESFGQNMTRSGLGAPTMLWSDVTLPWDDEALLWDDIGGDPYGKKATNGFSQWLEPALSMGSATRVIDFEALIPSTRVVVTIDKTDLVAGATLKTVLSVSQDAVAWTGFPEDQVEISTSNFRYLKIKLEANAPSGKGLIRINSIRFKLDVKQKTDQGTIDVFASDTNGTKVKLNKPFIDIDAVTATPRDIDAKIAVATFEDVGNQDEFYVRVYDRATGNRVNATISWIARGS